MVVKQKEIQAVIGMKAILIFLGYHSYGFYLWCRDAWLVPILTRFLPHTQARLTSAWNRICSGGHVNGGNTLKSAQSANNEIIEEDTLRNLTTDHLVLLRCTLGAKEGNFPFPKCTNTFGGDSLHTKHQANQF